MHRNIHIFLCNLLYRSLFGKKKSNLKLFYKTWPATSGDGGGGGACPPLFCTAERKKGTKGKKERVSKQKLLKGCHQGQNVTFLDILERLEFQKFVCRPSMVADNTFRIFRILFELFFKLYRICKISTESSLNRFFFL